MKLWFPPDFENEEEDWLQADADAAGEQANGNASNYVQNIRTAFTNIVCTMACLSYQWTLLHGWV